jgi:hypothetical protein
MSMDVTMSYNSVSTGWYVCMYMCVYMYVYGCHYVMYKHAHTNTHIAHTYKKKPYTQAQLAAKKAALEQELAKLSELMIE